MRTSRNSIIMAIFLTTAALALASCGRKPVYSHFEHVDTEGWDKTDTLCFKAAVNDSGKYAVTLGLRANSTYPYTSITMSVELRTAKTRQNIASLINIGITDDDGNRQGSGLTIQQLETALPDINASKSDTITVCVAHAMSRRTLTGITDVGITIGE